MPVVDVLVVIKVLAPLDKIVYLAIEILLRKHMQFMVIEWILIQLLELLLEL